MKSVHVAVKESVIRWAVQRSSNPAAVEEKFPNMKKWLQGESQPTLRQLEEFSKAVSVPLGYLFLSKPPKMELPIPYFRTLGDERMHQPGPDLLETVHIMERRQTWMREFLIEQGEEPLGFVRSATVTDNIEELAEKMRNTLRLSYDWANQHSTWTAALENLRNKIEEIGILVVVNGVVGNNTHRKLEPNEFRGFVLMDEYAPLVFINGADGKAAQMFTLAHELAHIWLGSSAAFDLRELQPASDETERACNKAAAEFLVPAGELQRIWPSVRRETEPYQAIARRFKVSELVAARRALDLSLITKDEFLRFYRAYQESERSIPSSQGGNFYATQNLRLSRRFATTVVRALKEGKLLYRDAFRLTGLYGETFDRYAQSLLGGKS